MEPIEPTLQGATMYYLTEPFLSSELAYRRQRIASGFIRPKHVRSRRRFWTAHVRRTRRVAHRLAVGH